MRENKLYDFTSNLVKIFEARNQILGKVDLQKTVYFMKRLGVDVPFEFRWNLLGPYSYELAHYCTSLEIEGLLSYSGFYSLDKEKAKFYTSALAPSTFNKLKEFFARIEEICLKNNYNKVAFIECAASLDFIRQNVSRTTLNKGYVFSLLEQLKPEKANLFKDLRNDSWNLLETEGLIS